MCRRQLLSVLVVLAASTTNANACPMCDSPRAAEVRAQLSDDLNTTTVAAVVTPFVAAAAVVSLVHFGVPSFRRRR